MDLISRERYVTCTRLLRQNTQETGESLSVRRRKKHMSVLLQANYHVFLDINHLADALSVVWLETLMIFGANLAIFFWPLLLLARSMGRTMHCPPCVLRPTRL